MKLINEEILKGLQKDYPKGTRIQLVRMDDEQAPPMGTKGTVSGVDDAGSIMVSWDNGSHLSVIYGEDEVVKLTTVCYNITSKVYVEVKADTTSNMEEEAEDILANMDFGVSEDIEWEKGEKR